ncbi:MAG: hypothetical protein U0794_16795 [Isosphaeraceae bacterium]
MSFFWSARNTQLPQLWSSGPRVAGGSRTDFSISIPRRTPGADPGLGFLPGLPSTMIYARPTVPFRSQPLLYSDNASFDSSGNNDLLFVLGGNPASPQLNVWRQCWEDDLVMTGVRSFDIKAYDNSVAGYVDLGWGNDGRQWPAGPGTAPTLLGVLGSTGSNTINSTYPSGFPWPPTFLNYYNVYNQTFAHEGRILPLVWDARSDYQYPGLLPNLGDDNTHVVRLRRVWDTWSTDYSYAPATGSHPVTGSPHGRGRVGGAPVYPSYPPPYPMALRGLQIQIRVVDPRNERIKVLTIRQDFSDRL